jgi:hypothetical protein
MRQSTMIKSAEVDGQSRQSAYTIAFAVSFEHESLDPAKRVVKSSSFRRPVARRRQPIYRKMVQEIMEQSRLAALVTLLPSIRRDLDFVRPPTADKIVLGGGRKSNGKYPTGN